MLVRLFLAAITATLIAACAGAQPGATSPGAVNLRTWAPGSPAACPMARTEGALIRDAQSGAGLRDNEGVVWQVIWPIEYTARDDGGRLAVFDGAETVIAHEGDRVEIGGAEVESGTFLGCGGMRILDP
jgi:hypothetical protein